MSMQGTPRGTGVSWIVWLTAALLLVGIVLGFTGGWKLHEVLGTVAMAVLLVGFLRQRQQLHQKRSPRSGVEGTDETTD
jgi:hypothetical protein